MLYSIRCLHNKLFPIKFVFFIITSADWTVGVQSRAMIPMRFWGRSQMEEKSWSLCIKYIHVPLFPCCFHISLFLSASLILRWRVCCRMTGATWQQSRPHICLTAVPLSPTPQQPPTVLVQLSAHFRVYLKVCRCISQSSNDRLLQRSLVRVTNGAETSLKALRNGFIQCHLSHCLPVPI